MSIDLYYRTTPNGHKVLVHGARQLALQVDERDGVVVALALAHVAHHRERAARCNRQPVGPQPAGRADDDALWQRARGWALAHAIATLGNSGDQPALQATGARTLQNVRA